MELANPERVWLLALCLAMAGWAVRGRVIRGRAWRALGWSGRAPRDGAWITLLTCVLLVLALMRPRWLGRGETEGGLGRDVVLAVDVSRSMAVEDAVPNRLAAALDAADSLLRAIAADPASRAGVVAFAGQGVIRCPLTENLGAVRDALRRLKPGSVQPGGTDLAAAVEAALDLFQPDQPSAGRAIVIFSDGEDHENRWRSLAKRLEENSVTIHAVAIGDDQVGRAVPFDSADTRLVYQGRPVESRRVDQALLNLVHESGGTFIPLGVSTVDLGALYVSRIEPATRRSARSPTLDRKDWFPVLLFCALVLAPAGSWPPVPAWPRFPWWRKRAPTTPKPSKPAIVAGLAMIALGLAASDVPVEKRRAADAVARGQELYQEGRFDLALESFNQAAKLAPAHSIPRYNAASTLFQMGRFDEARAHYLTARKGADPALTAKIDFALGNTAVSLGDLNQAIACYDDCLDSPARGPGLDAVRRDAAENRAFALERLKNVGPHEPPNADHTTAEREPREDPTGKDQKELETEAKKGKPSNAPRGRGGQPRPASGTHRTGGAGGSSSQGASDPNRSPDDRLSDALDKIQDALDDRLSDESRPPPARDNHKDW